MFDKHLKDEIEVLKGRLETLEHQEFGKKIGELRKANHKRALKLAFLQGIAACLLTLLSGIAIYYGDQARRESKENRENLPEVYEVLLDIFKTKLGDTIDRISLSAPKYEDKVMVTEVSDMRDQLGKVIASNPKFIALSKLTDALNQIVFEGKVKGKAEEARNKLESDKLPYSSDRFIASRAFLLQATANFHPNGLCNQTDLTLDLISKGRRQDSGVVAAINLEGVCLAQKSYDVLNEKSTDDLAKDPTLWKDSVTNILAALSVNKSAYEFKSTQWSKVRFLNNKAWDSMQFLKAAMSINQEKLREALQLIGKYNDMEPFFADSLQDVRDCQSLSPDRPTCFETEAELHAFEYAYYTNSSYKGNGDPKEAKKSMLQQLGFAMDKDLLGKYSTLKDAIDYFRSDIFLEPFFTGPESTIDPEIEALIRQRTNLR
jgi:hypothetical protein